jgi:hypothetical protein
VTSIKHNKFVAAQVLADQFASSEAAVTTLANTFYSQVLQLREAFPPQDDKGLGGPDPATRATAWRRDDAFADPG